MASKKVHWALSPSSSSSEEEESKASILTYEETFVSKHLHTMERNEGIIRWSPNPSRDEFMVFNLNNRVAHLYKATGHASPEKFDFAKSSKHTNIPNINTYDWSPVHRGLISVGTAQGHVYLLRVDDNSDAILPLPLKLQRAVQSVAFNTGGLLAVGLDRVRNDTCLQIWDLNERFAKSGFSQPGFDAAATQNFEAKKRLEGSTSITSIRFFEDQPQVLVYGVKNQSVRVHDLRDPSATVLSFTTRCNNNIAIDYMDSNYFASSSLDQPGLIVWDRRTASRPSASPMYLESFDQDEVPWGSVLKLDRAIQGDKDVFIKQLRYCREHRGALGVLSTAGQLQVLQTKKEFVEPGSPDDVAGSPEMLEVQKSYDLEYPYFDQDHKQKQENRIVSFDWLNVGTMDLCPRVVALRATGQFEILQMPATTANQLGQFVAWKPPHKLGDSYMTLMEFSDPKEREEMIGPLHATALKAAVPVFGPDGYKSGSRSFAVKAALNEALESSVDPVADLLAPSAAILVKDDPPATEAMEDSFSQLRIDTNSGKKPQLQEDSADDVKRPNIQSSRELYDKSHYATLACQPADKATHDKLDHVMLQRAVDGYLFNCKINRGIVTGDPWLQGVWDWIGEAEKAAMNDRMVSEPLDLSYLGVHSIWMNSLGKKSASRLIDTTTVPDEAQWENCIGLLNRQASRSKFNGVKTAKPEHRQLCLAICGQLKPSRDFEDNLKALQMDDMFTKAAAWALFEGLSDQAVEILKNGGPNLLFAAMALDIKLKSNSSLDLDYSAWKRAFESHPQLAEDPYLRAIYRYMTSGSWEAVADERSLPLRDRVWVALRNFDDDKLTYWLAREMEEAIKTGDIEAIVLAGISDSMADVLQKYIEKFMDYQTPILIMSFCYPHYITDDRCHAWRTDYKAFLNRHKQFIRKVMFDQQSTKKSVDRDGIPVIKPPPRQVTLRCLNCDKNAANDLQNSGQGTTSVASSSTVDMRNPLQASGINAGLCCPKCGAHLPRCAICMQIVGVPRSDRPEQSTDPQIRRLANFPTFCLKCKHCCHADHARDWFKRHVECPVPECHCQCNAR